MMTAAEQKRIAALEARVETLLSLLARAGEYAGVDLTVSQPEPMGQLYAFPAGGRRDTHKRVAGRTAGVTPFAASRRASTLGTAS